MACCYSHYVYSMQRVIIRRTTSAKSNLNSFCLHIWFHTFIVFDVKHEFELKIQIHMQMQIHYPYIAYVKACTFFITSTFSWRCLCVRCSVMTFSLFKNLNIHGVVESTKRTNNKPSFKKKAREKMSCRWYIYSENIITFHMHVDTAFQVSWTKDDSTYMQLNIIGFQTQKHGMCTPKIIFEFHSETYTFHYLTIFWVSWIAYIICSNDLDPCVILDTWNTFRNDWLLKISVFELFQFIDLKIARYSLPQVIFSEVLWGSMNNLQCCYTCTFTDVRLQMLLSTFSTKC